MKITESTVAMQSQHASLSLHSTQMRLRSWVGNQRPDFEGRAQQQGTPGVRFTLSEVARSQLARLSQAQATRSASRSEVGTLADDASPIEPRMRVLMEMVQAITGREVKVFNARDLQPQTGAGDVATPAPAQAAASASATPQPAGWGLELDATERVVEAEAMQVSAQGEVRTADGQNIAFSLQLAMSRSFVQESSVSVRAGDAVRQDPLVINFNGSGAELSDAQFAFDLDADGQTENMAFVRGGSGFLVFDKNADGQVNNGSELFGPASGDGFADLAQYDLDGNQWIDENDAVYSQLQVWQRDAGGQDRLTTLAQNGVGALFLGRVASPFSVNTAANQTLGLVRSTGVFLYESGAVGTLQQVDL
ncbi:MAG: hypothetical protein BWK72_00760 [Rhodoferax ferrireducens]|uniref:VCBS repeat-containing protein n=1 Tax=Rhodoferax ferrireducens TaxID=192843 RepID=A0A1W9KYJ1_9BURK|nr:MAG: hypothetical protein BWK72_00760 [Rhodoferax ferrireducens]